MAETKALFVVLAVTSFAAAGADTGVRGPSLGYSVERAAVRLITGTPGAALAGAAIDLGGTVRTAAASNAAGFVIAVVGDEGRVVLFRDSAVTLAGALPAADHVAVSPRGRVAVLYSSQTDSLQLITGLPGNPALGAPIPLPYPANAIAISDTGTVLAGGGDGLWSVQTTLRPSPDAPVARMVYSAGARSTAPVRPQPSFLHAGTISAIAFFENSNDAAFAADGIVWIRRGAAITPLGDAHGALAVQAASQFVLAATDKSVIRFELATGARSEMPCDFAVTALDRMSAGAVFRLNDGSGGPVYLYDASGPEPRVVFVPAVQEGDAR